MFSGAFVQIKAAFPRNTAGLGRIYLFFCLVTCLQTALADTIGQAGSQGALGIGAANDLNLPGTPLPDYTFPWEPNLFMSNLQPGDPGFFDLGLDLGSFLFTGNTYFSFTGTLQLTVFEAVPPAPVINPPSSVDNIQPASSFVGIPEPGTVWLVPGAMVLSALRKKGAPERFRASSSLAN